MTDDQPAANEALQMVTAPLVGNDVVDLDDPAIATHHLRERFVHRVCHERERAMLARSDAPKALLWTLFAAKEAAFKIVAKLDPQAVFAHSRFVVANDLRAVVWGDLTLPLRVDVTDAWVHAVVCTARAPICAVEESGGEPSVAARELLCRLVAAELGCVADDLAVVRDPRPGSWTGYGPPRLVSRDGRAIAADVSLSHDGRFVGCAAHVRSRGDVSSSSLPDGRCHPVLPW
ncbi:MAG: 4-phosphopantetheinyl transferase family protein [Deltaproteobacteria bacterium]|nr:4-phosphopantetheinyl transferase family protein [Deltaproteobacteria bacterium]